MNHRTPCVVTLMLDENDKLWLCERIGTESFVGYWQAGGGRVEGGEDMFEAAERELREEAAITPGGRLEYMGCDAGAISSDGKPFPLHYFRIRLGPNEVPQCTEPELHGPWVRYSKEQTKDLKLMPGLLHRWCSPWVAAQE